MFVAVVRRRLTHLDLTSSLFRKLKKEEIQKYYDIKEKLGTSGKRHRGRERGGGERGRHNREGGIDEKEWGKSLQEGKST